jgi:pimeloyl-ACP methyl ester carboxylesterase
MENRIHIYFMPGLAASSKIFEYIKLPQESFECHYLEWSVPDSIDESLVSYAKKYASQIQHEEVVLVGVSFGGILVQEISKLIPVKRVIIISSLKTIDEIPKRLKLLKYTRAYHLFPTRRISRIDTFSKYDFFKPFKKKAELYDKYFSIRNEIYLNWALHNLLYWENKEIMAKVTHIHGNKDEILPIKHIDDCISIEGGTHAMIIIKAKQISEIIENLLLP